MKQLLKIKAVGLLLMLLTIGLVKAQSPAEPVRSGDQTVPHWDAAGYDAQKTQWVNENPDLYNQMINNQGKEAPAPANTPWGAPENKDQWVAEHPQEYAELARMAQDTRVKMTRAEFNAYPADKQERILKDANIVIID